MEEHTEWRSGKAFGRPTTGKTIAKFCKFFAEDRCHRGKLCTFAHSEEDIGKDWVVRPEEGFYKDRLCPFWRAGGLCKIAVMQ